MTVDPLSTNSPANWASNLEGAVQSRGKIFGDHLYIWVKKGEQHEKLSIKNIIDISNSQFESLSASYKEGKINRENFNDLSGKISDLTEQLIDARIAKRNQPLKVLGRQIAYAVSAFASLFGVSAFKSLKASDKAFQDEIEDSKTSLAKAKEAAVAAVLEDKRTKIEELAKNIPPIIKELEKLITKEEVEKLLTERILTDIHLEPGEASPTTPYTPQFKKDMERNVQFKRNDSTQNINDQTPLPNIQPGENNDILQVLDQRVNRGVEAVHALIIHTEDKQWEKIIQSACTQSSLNAIFDAPILLFSIESAPHTWQEDEHDYKAVLKLPDPFPPIQVEVIRDPETQAIQKVNVALESSLSIAREPKNVEANKENSSIEAQDVMKGSIHYSITLDGNNNPVIELTHYELTP